MWHPLAKQKNPLAPGLWPLVIFLARVGAKFNTGECVNTHIIEEFAVFGRPSDLHNAGCDDHHLIIPDTAVHLECTTHTFKRRSITPGLQKSKNNQN